MTVNFQLVFQLEWQFFTKKKFYEIAMTISTLDQIPVSYDPLVFFTFSKNLAYIWNKENRL